MKFFKTLFLLSISTLAINAWASGPQVSMLLYTVAKGVEIDSTNADYETFGPTYAGLTYEDGSSIIENESIRVLFVTPGTTESGAQYTPAAPVFKNPESLFSFDQLGNFSLTDAGKACIATYEWSDPIRATANSTYGGYVDSAIYSGKVYFTQVTHTFESEAPYYMAFIFTFDSREVANETGDYAVDTSVTRVHKWGIIKPSNGPISLKSVTSGPSIGGSVSSTVPSFIVDLTVTGARTIPYEEPSVLATDVLSFTIGETVYADTNEDDALKLTPHLTPSMSAVVANTTNDGFELTCGLVGEGFRDVLTYTLQTKASLSDPWVTMDSVIEKLSNETKNSLANNLEKRYTYLRVKESTQIKIPKLPGETQRFYRLIAE